MPKEKFKLSETVRFMTRTLNAIVGGEQVTLELRLEADRVEAGGELVASAVVRSPEQARVLDALVLGIRGVVQDGERWRDYSETVEVAQGVELPAGHELIVPIAIRVPDDAVLSEDGASWLLEGRAGIDRLIDPRAEVRFIVLAPHDEAPQQE